MNKRHPRYEMGWAPIAMPMLYEHRSLSNRDGGFVTHYLELKPLPATMKQLPGTNHDFTTMAIYICPYCSFENLIDEADPSSDRCYICGRTISFNISAGAPA